MQTSPVGETPTDADRGLANCIAQTMRGLLGGFAGTEEDTDPRYVAYVQGMAFRVAAFRPRDVPEVIAADHYLMCHRALSDGVIDLLVEPATAVRARLRRQINAMDRNFLSHSRELHRLRRRKPDEITSPLVPAGEATADPEASSAMPEAPRSAPMEPTRNPGKTTVPEAFAQQPPTAEASILTAGKFPASKAEIIAMAKIVAARLASTAMPASVAPRADATGAPAAIPGENSWRPPQMIFPSSEETGLPTEAGPSSMAPPAETPDLTPAPEAASPSRPMNRAQRRLAQKLERKTAKRVARTVFRTPASGETSSTA